MMQQKPNSSKMRVAVISASRNQREHLRRLIEEHGPKVVAASGFRDYNATIGSQKPDVLLIDLDQADDVALDRMERLIEQSKIPILFNESTAIPLTPGPYRDDWLDNLVGKLFNLAQKRDVTAMSALLDRPRYSNSSPRLALPKVLVVSHSKTRRCVLQIILASQAIKDTAEASFAAGYLPGTLKAYNVLLLDEHNVGPEDSVVFDQLLAQSEVPIKLCNSSRIPHSVTERNRWGIQLAGQLIKISKSVADKALIDSAGVTQGNLSPLELATKVFAKSPTTITDSALPTRSTLAAKTGTAKPIQPRDSARKFKKADRLAASTTRVIPPQTDLKYRPPKTEGARNAQKATAVKVELTGPTDTLNVVEINNDTSRIRAPEKNPTKEKESDIFDAETIRLLADNDSWVTSIAALSKAERDSEISRFFNFNLEPVAEIAANNELTEHLNTEKHMEKKSIQNWFRSLAGIRQKLPKLFH